MTESTKQPTPVTTQLHTTLDLSRKRLSSFQTVPHTHPKTVRFDTSQNKPTTHKHPAALKVCNTLWDRRPTRGALDSGATSHFLPATYMGTNHQTTPQGDGILVQCANDTTMRSVATDKLNLQSLPAAARTCHKFEHMPTPLLSVKTFCDNDLDVLFQRNKVTVTNAGGSTVLEGELDPTTDLYMVPLNDKPDGSQSQGGGVTPIDQRPWQPKRSAPPSTKPITPTPSPKK